MDPQNPVAPPAEVTGPPHLTMEDLGLPPADGAAPSPEPVQTPPVQQAPEPPATPEPEQRAGETDAAFAERERQYQAQLDAVSRRAQEAEQRLQQYNAQMQQVAQLVERQREQRLLEEVKDLHPDEAIQRVRGYYAEQLARQQQQVQAMQQQSQQAVYQQALQQWAAEHARANGLSDADLIELLDTTDPDRIPLKAQSIKKQRDAQAAKEAEWQRKLDQFALTHQATQMAGSGAHAVAGAGQGAPVEQPKPGSREQLLALAGDFFDF